MGVECYYRSRVTDSAWRRLIACVWSYIPRSKLDAGNLFLSLAGYQWGQPFWAAAALSGGVALNRANSSGVTRARISATATPPERAAAGQKASPHMVAITTSGCRRIACAENQPQTITHSWE